MRKEEEVEGMREGMRRWREGREGGKEMRNVWTASY